MNKIYLLIILIFSMCSASTQNEPINKYLESFKEISKEGPGNFRVLLHEGENMTKEQALSFVYQNDTSKLFCHFQEIDMETEERGAFTTELYLPQKCLKLSTPNFILIGYSSFECQDPNKLVETFLTLKIIDPENFRTTDSLVVYHGNEYDWKVTGLINPRNNKVFKIEQLGKTEFNARATIYRIVNLKFEVEQQQEHIKGISDDLEQGVESIGWKQTFLQ